MSNVALWIGGRSYTVNCAAGEEDHIAELGAMIDAKLTSMGAPGHNETRTLLFAALLLADEVFELRSGGGPAAAAQAAAAESPAESPYATPDPLPYEAPAFSIDPERLEGIANRLENLASHLER
ncbi:MAG: cell division protein ZapA [Novosphingobium sp.]